MHLLNYLLSQGILHKVSSPTARPATIKKVARFACAKAISYGFRTVAFFLDGGATVRAPPSPLYVDGKTLIAVWTKLGRWQQVYF